MENLIKTLGLILDEQVFISINERVSLSIVLEENHHGVDDKGFMYVSRKPLGYKLNCATQEGGENTEYFTVMSEEEFYILMNNLKNKNMKKIIGQEKLMKDIERILTIFKASECKIKPHFILTGGSGSGKTYVIKHICEKFDMNFLEINAAQLTKEGTSGNSLSKALSPLMQFSNKPTIVFVDEFDKLFISGNSNSDLAHESTNGVQNEFLKVLESAEASVFGDYGKYINISTKNILFIFAGAFNGEEDINLDRLRQLGIKTEFIGRVGLIYNTQPLTLNDLLEILTTSELLKTYLSLYAEVNKDDVVNIIQGFVKKHFHLNTLGARMINTLIHQYFINGGKLEDKMVEESTFQTKLSLK